MPIKTISQDFFQQLLRPKVARGIIISAILLIVADMLYSNIAGINQINRETTCIIYTSMPRWLFLIYEYFFELAIVVMLGVFASTMIETYFKKIKRFFPKNQIMAFTYGAILPICSCGVIPLIETMKSRVSIKVMITFLIAAPLLNPYIIILAVSVYGIKYCLLRIVSAFILAVSTGLLTEFFAKKLDCYHPDKYENCLPKCHTYEKDPFVRTIRLTKSLLPYILIGGILSIGLELFNPKQYLSWFNFSNPWISMGIMAAIGVPLYVCNGADILLLKPLMAFTDLSIGSAMVFSLTSSAVCVSSIVMFSRFLGKKMTWILVTNLVVITLLIGTLLNLLNP